MSTALFWWAFLSAGESPANFRRVESGKGELPMLAGNLLFPVSKEEFICANCAEG
ncbi:hypothetical protein KUG47_11585 [Falsochrobactrum sp. TDYN1]|uniref:Uncharacterized protein n=1 Tax=Falsochrobactrum tianjinense TaxID=2706015 RepID=A0A949UTS9_9HYPH|nr:hypothetical protein [Falsochrobactrum sp. TDYN1]